MSSELKIFLTLSILIFFAYVIINVKNNKLSVRNSIIWLIMCIAIIICIYTIPLLAVISHLIGIETVSNFLFFLGFIFLIYVCYDLSKTISMQNKKITTLTQELALLKKEIDDKNKK